MPENKIETKLEAKSKSKMEITKATWDGLPTKDKRTWKDGTRHIRVKTQKDTVLDNWVEVYWCR